ncbi:hypothetical protein O0L34_g15326 [Tuta absoluta]|nr:hypothetical protein O0L34_g15326 [Tuta absoluta]
MFLLLVILEICIQANSSEGLELLDTDVTDVTNNVDLADELANLPEVIRTLDLPHLPDLPNPRKHKFLYELGLTNKERFMNFTQLACKYKRNVSTHLVKTRDGYILTLFRLYGPGDAVFLMHGLFSSANDWITPGPESSIAYLLNDAGYDVWLGNSRGNTYSRRHECLSPDDDAARFWDFSWHEIGLEDLPAMIDHVLNVTGQSKLKYIGHSQGGTSFLVMCSLRPEYNTKISIAIGLSPACFMSHIRSPILRVLSKINTIADLLVTKLIGLHEFVPNMELIRSIKGVVCGTRIVASTVCTSTFYIGGGFNFAQQNDSQLPVILEHIPSSVASKQLLHYAQLVVSKLFQQYDYGPRNHEMYGSEKPPCYPLERISAPVVIMYGDGDWIVTPEDSRTLRDKLTNLVGFIKVKFPKFNHFDFLWAKDMKTLIMTHLYRFLGSYYE